MTLGVWFASQSGVTRSISDLEDPDAAGSADGADMDGNDPSLVWQSRPPGFDTGALPDAVAEESIQLVSLNQESLSPTGISERSVAWTPQQRPQPAARREVFGSIALPPIYLREQYRGIVINNVCRRGAVIQSFRDARGRVGGDTTTVTLIDLSSGEVLGTDTIDGDYDPGALHDDGIHLLMQSSRRRREQSAGVELWRMTTEGLERVRGWYPFPKGRESSWDAPEWVGLLDATQAAAANSRGELIIWPLDSDEASHLLSFDGHSIPSISPDGQLLLLPDEGGVQCWDIAAGDWTFFLPMPDRSPRHVAFSPSGQWILATRIDNSGCGLMVFDAGTGQMISDMVLPKVSGQIAHIIDDRWALLGSSPRHLRLIDLDTQIPVWSYEMNAYGSGDGQLWAVGKGDQGSDLATLHRLEMPHPEAVEQITSFLQGADAFALQPGAAVAIDVSGIRDASRQSEVREALAGRLQAIGARVVDRSDVRLVATTTPRPSRTIKVNTDPFRMRDSMLVQRQARLQGKPVPRQEPVVREMRVTEHDVMLQLVADGKAVWELTSGSRVPSYMHAQGDETLEQAVARYTQPPYRFFRNVRLPARILRNASETQTLGETRVLGTGLVDANQYKADRQAQWDAVMQRTAEARSRAPRPGGIPTAKPPQQAPSPTGSTKRDAGF